MNISLKDEHNKGQKCYGPNRSRRYSEAVARLHRKTIQKKIFKTQITMMVIVNGEMCQISEDLVSGPKTSLIAQGSCVAEKGQRKLLI